MTTTTALTCERCGGDMELLQSDAIGAVLHCTDCGRAIPAGPAVALKLRGLQPGRQAVTVREAEEPIMARIVRVLQAAGYEVLSTVHRHTRHTCSACGHNEWHRGGYGATPGVPDLLARGKDFPEGVFIGLETKGTHTRLNEAQKRLQASGAIVVARSEAEALAAIQQAEARLGDRAGSVDRGAKR